MSDLDDGREGSWVGYTSAAKDLGVGSVFAFPLHLGGARFGVLTMYGDSPQPLDRLRTARCLALSDLATEALLAGSDARTDGRLDPDLESALDFRSEIYQAQGMVMVTLGTDLPDALARMRAHAFQPNGPCWRCPSTIFEGRLVLPDEEAAP